MISAETTDRTITMARVDASALASHLALRIDALTQFHRAAEPHLPKEWLADAQAVVAAANARLARSRAHTVVAIAGTTGSGKSSLFNALSGMELSEVDIRRPTTATVHACVWGRPDEAVPLLDWLEVPARQRFLRESPLDGDDQAGLRGLILLDLPDFDSLHAEHAAEVERVLALVDQIVWVTDPQKYADRVFHDQLRRFRRYQQVMVVVLNQVDLLTPADTHAILVDLRRLLVADGLPEVPVLAASAVAGNGPADLRQLLQQRVAGRRAVFQRLSADLDEVVAGLADLVGPPATDPLAPDEPLVDELVEEAGVGPVVDAVADWYARQSRARMRSWGGRAPKPPALPDPPDSTSRQAAVSLIARGYADRVSGGLPMPWPSAITDAARSRLDKLPEALHTALTDTLAPYWHRTPWWWAVVRHLRRLSLGLVLVGGAVLAWFWAGVADPTLSPAGAGLAVAGLGLMLAATVLGRPLAHRAARRIRDELGQQLRQAITQVAREYVVDPVDHVRQSYEQARVALATARSDPA